MVWPGKWASACAVALALALAATGCGGDDETEAGGAAAGNASGSAPAPIADEGELTACMDVSFPPMEYYESAGSRTPVGFDVDLISAIAKQWGVTPQFSETSFDGLLPALSGGRCDVVASGIFITEERTATFPAVPYLKSRRVLLVRSGNPEGIGSLEDLAGKTAATQVSTEYEKTLRQLDKDLKAEGKPGINIQTYPKASDAVQQLVVGRAVAVYTQDTEAAFRSKAQPGEFEIAFEDPSSETFGIYHRKDQAELGDGLESAVEKLRQDGELAEIAKRWGLPESGVQE
jgi:polar amino acid transport system substrate-binding protein